MVQTTAILLGCVSHKRDRASPAGDLYRSALWPRRRGYAEASGRPWLILSALRGVLDPDTLIDLPIRILREACSTTAFP
jgi:hypothetical protein